MSSRDRQSSVLARSVASFAALMLVCAMATTGSAAPVTANGIHWTGTGGGSTDPYWTVVAYPGTYPGDYNEDPYAPPPSTPITPYAAFIPSGGTPPYNIPNQWYGGNTNHGMYDSRWIGLSFNDVASLWTGNVTPANYQDYTTVYRSSFTASGTGEAFISLRVAADNAVTFFVASTDPGTGADTNIDYTNVWRPTVVGQQVGVEKIGLGSLGWVEGTVNVAAGTNYLYAVVRDKLTTSGSVGNYGFTGFIAVPEPSSIVLAGLGVAGFALRALLRRGKKS